MERIYMRVSTTAQEFSQQKECIERYLKSIGRSFDELEVVEEKISGCKDFSERKLNDLINSCEEGDVILVSELSRLGRNMTNLFVLVDMATQKGIKFIQCKDGMPLEKDSIAGKTLLFALSIAAEMEAEQKRQRINMGHAAKKKEIAEHGGFTNRRGEWCEGSYKQQYGKRSGGCHKRSCTIAGKVSAERRKQKALNNEHNIKFVDALQLFEESNGRIGANTDITPFVRMLNKLKLKTSTGLEFNNARAKAMLTSMRNIFDLYAI